MKNKILIRVYFVSAVVVTAVMTLLCALFQWSSSMLLFVLLSCLIISAPFTVFLHLIFWMIQKIRAVKVFFWMVLMASVPLLAFFPAEMFANRLPGDPWFLFLVGVSAAYTGILTNGISIAQIFNSSQS